MRYGNNVKHYINYKLKGFKEWLMIGMLKAYWARRQKRFNADIYERIRQRARMAINLSATIKCDRMEQRCMPVVHHFIINHVDNYNLICCFRDFHATIRKLQRGLLDKMAVRHSKVEVLSSYWEKLINGILLRATHLKDEMTKLFCKTIIHVPK